MVIKVQFTETDQHIAVEFEETGDILTADVGEVTEVFRDGIQDFIGPYKVMPTSEMQVLETKNKLMAENLVVSPIPNNYGLVTYNQDRVLMIT